MLDLSRFSALAGRAVGGSGTIRAEGFVGLLSGMIDGQVDVEAQERILAPLPEQERGEFMRMLGVLIASRNESDRDTAT